ncbi:hypothetical protein LOD99_16100 [Oopsacas minuta]|uniref:Transmembrane protein 35A n=1 Tax=Oopsacas minuta TaxID=111878 RepID=A0AAV7K628_9METZ|nr:hypothetical protein LOD99_16100 [Oopsacas minuta]
MRVIINRILTIVIVLIFLLAGYMKLSIRFSYELHVHLQREFHRYVTVAPTCLFGYTPDPDNYRTLVGVSEIVLAILLLVGTRNLRILANHLLLLMMVGAFYTHCSLGDPVSQVVPPMVMTFLISWRYFTIGVFIKPDSVKQD